MTAPGGPRSHLALPEVLPAPGVLVLHPWWGLVPDVIAFADRLAAAGYVALAPDLYGGGQTAATVEEAKALAHALEQDDLDARTRAGLDELLARDDVTGDRTGVVGFSLGGGAALMLATHHAPEHVAALVLYYEAYADLPWDRLRAPVLGHYASEDDFVEPAEIDAMRAAVEAAGGTIETHVYPGTQHWFAEPSRPEHREAAASLAWGRTLKLLESQFR